MLEMFQTNLTRFLSCGSQQRLVSKEFDKKLSVANISSDFKVAVEMFKR
jgi:hypothetical protein